jgi:hypothetical protein
MNNTADWNVTSCCLYTFTDGSKEPEGGDGRFLRSVGKFVPDTTALLVLTSLETSDLSYQTGCGESQHFPWRGLYVMCVKSMELTLGGKTCL